MSRKPISLTCISIALWLLGSILFSATGTAQAANVILNPEFDSGTASWSLSNFGGAASTLSVVTGAGLSGTNAAKVTITNAGTASWHVQLRQAMPITAGKTYTITFKAKADAARTMNVVIQQANDPWTSYYTSPTVSLTTTAQTFGPYTYTASTTDAGTLLEFYLGGNASSVYIDQVIIDDGSSSGSNVILNPEFDSGTANWSSSNFGGAASTLSVVTGAGLSGTNAAKVTITNAGTAGWHIQLRQAMPITAGKTYTITFKAKADAARTMNVVIQQANDPWTSYYTSPSINLTTSAQTFGPYTYTASTTDAGTLLEFYLGGNASAVYIDNVIVTDGSSAPTQVLFDDFNYTSSTDSNLTNFGWVVRTGAGGPGCPGSWSGSNITFQDAGGGNRIMQLTASNSGSAACANASQAELYTANRKFFEGTYAARVYFTDAPTSGPDGDQIIETFFTYYPPASEIYDVTHREFDFEYLPNGGFGTKIPTSGGMLNTSWDTYCYDDTTPYECLGGIGWDEVVETSKSLTSFAGWHTVVIQIANGLIKYYIDNTLVGTHSDPHNPPAPHSIVGSYDVYPEGLMSIHFNLWFFVPGITASSTPRTYYQNVDWVYYAKDTVLSPAQVEAYAANYRSQGTVRLDTVP